VAKVKNKLKPVNAPVYNYWEALYRSFYSRLLYIDVGKRWRGLGLLYFLLTIALFSIPFAVRVAMNLNQSFNNQIIDPLFQLPPVYVQNGQVSFDKPMPYFIKNKEGQAVIIVDTTGAVTNLSKDYPYLNVLITKNKIIFKLPTPELFTMTAPEQNKGVAWEQTLSPEMNTVFDGKKLVEDNSIVTLKYLSELMIYPIVIGLIFGIFVVLFLAMALLGQVFSRIFFSFSLGFVQSSRLLMVAVTPMLLVLMILLTVNVMFPGFGFILMALLAAYFSFAISAVKSDSRKVVPT